MKRCIVFCLLFSFGKLVAQSDTVHLFENKDSCVQFALRNFPAISQSLLDEQITNRQIQSALADWFPQLNLNANYQNNFLLQKTKFGDQIINIGTFNSSTAQFALTQTIFNRDVLLASTSAKDVRLRSRQLTTNTKIAIAAEVSKAFYDVLLSTRQIQLIDTDIVLLTRTLRDAYNQYKGGLVDKTDYQRATISLNNARAQLKNAEADLRSKYAVLKQLMSFPQEKTLLVKYDSTEFMRDVLNVDTTEVLNYENRIEYQLLQTQQKLLNDNLHYYKWGFLPSLSAFGQYNFNWFSNDFVKLYNENFPNAYAGLSLSFPIFQGTKRLQQVRIAELQLKRLDYDFRAMKDSIGSQYTQALAAYKANLAYFHVQRENLELASDVYNVIRLQYRAGVKTYLDVITANNDLFTAQINVINAAFEVMVNKIDLERALGILKY